jgi:hypothetical protein
MRTHENEIGNALVSLALKMVLGQPQGIKAEFVHKHRHLFSHSEAFHETLVGIQASVGRRPISADIFKFNLTHIEDGKMLDHVLCSP